GIGGGAVEREVGVDADATVKLPAAHAHLLGGGEVAADHADGTVGDLRLEVLDLRLENGDVCRDVTERRGLQPELDVAHVFRLDGRRGEDRVARRVGRQAVQVEADRLEAGRIGRIGVDALGHLVGRGDLTGRVGIAHV